MKSSDKESIDYSIFLDEKYQDDCKITSLDETIAFLGLMDRFPEKPIYELDELMFKFREEANL